MRAHTDTTQNCNKTPTIGYVLHMLPSFLLTLAGNPEDSFDFFML